MRFEYVAHLCYLCFLVSCPALCLLRSSLPCKRIFWSLTMLYGLLIFGVFINLIYKGLMSLQRRGIIALLLVLSVATSSYAAKGASRKVSYTVPGTNRTYTLTYSAPSAHIISPLPLRTIGAQHIPTNSNGIFQGNNYHKNDGSAIFNAGAPK